MNYGLSVNNTLSLTNQYAEQLEALKQLEVPRPKSWENKKKASKDWYYGFMKRNPTLSLRKPTPTSIARSKGFCKQSVDDFFTNYRSVFDENVYPPGRIWNLDETSCTTVPPKPGKVIAEKGSDIGRMTSAEKGTNVTMCLAVSAAGDSIKPFFIFPRKNWQRNFLARSTPGAVGCANGSGWMDIETFIKYFKHFIDETHASKENPLLLVMDNHVSHISLPIVQLAKDHGIEIVTLPPHCSHRLQPLDVSVFGPFKHYYDVVCDDWSKSNAGRGIEIHQVAEMADKAMDESVNKKNIRAGFAKTGIYPLDRTKFNESDFLAAKLSGENVSAEQEEEALGADDRRSILVYFDEVDEQPAAVEEVATSEASTSVVSTSEANTSEANTSVASTSVANSSVASTSGASTELTTLQLRLAQMGPVQFGASRKKKNKNKSGQKGMQSMVLTSAEVAAQLQEKADLKIATAQKKEAAAAKRAANKVAKAQKAAETAARKAHREKTKAEKAKITADKKAAKEAAKAKKGAAAATEEGSMTATPKTSAKRKLKPNNKGAQKRKKRVSSSSEEDVDFCMAKGCGQLLDMPMTKNNTIECNKCGRPYHLRCVKMRSFFTCDNCDSDLDVSDEAADDE